MNKWRPIKTAPSMRRVILTFNFDDVYSGMKEDDGHWYDGAWAAPTPSHWMPLPPPPESEEV